MSKKILITGGRGQLGQYLFKSFQGIYNVINTFPKGAANSYSLDVTNSKQVELVLNQESPDIIINCASYNSVDKCESDKISARDIIVEGLRNIVKFSDKNSMIVHISSDYIFDGEKKKLF